MNRFGAFTLACVLALLALVPVSDAGLVTQTGPKYFTAAADTTPDSFSFTDQTGVSTSSTITSATVPVNGINASITCNATGGTIDVNSSGSFASSQSVSNTNTIRARHTSSASNSTAVNTVVDCNGVSDTFTSTTVAGGSALPGFTPDTNFTVNGTDVNQYTALTIIDSAGRLGNRANAKAYQVWTFDTNTAPVSAYSRDTSSYDVSDGTRVTTTTQGIAIPTGSTGMYFVNTFQGTGNVAHPVPTWTASSTTKTMLITEEYIGWDIPNDCETTDWKTIRYRDDTPGAAHSVFAGFQPMSTQSTYCMGGLGAAFVVENSVPESGGNSTFYFGSNNSPVLQWTVVQSFLSQSTAVNAVDGFHYYFLNGRVQMDPAQLFKTRSTSYSGQFSGVFQHQFSNGYSMDQDAGIATAFQLFDTEWGIAFWSDESSITLTEGAGSTSQYRAYLIPNGLTTSSGTSTFTMVNRKGQFSSLVGKYLWVITPSMTFIRVGQKTSAAFEVPLFLPADAANDDYFERRAAA